MKLDVTQQIMRLDNPAKPLLTRPKKREDGSDDPESKPVTLRYVLVEALLASYKGEEKIEQSKKLNRWHLAKRVQRDDAPEVTVNEVATCQKLIFKAFGLSIAGPATEMLEAAAGQKVVAETDEADETHDDVE